MAAVTTTTESDENDASYAVRYEIRSMGDALEGRFWAAIRTMCQNKNGVAGTSEYFRLASIHGLPGEDYCEHQAESFPSWHRIYLAQFEQALQVTFNFKFGTVIRNVNNQRTTHNVVLYKI